ncbi:MAG TPA: hypothetical protein VEH04_18090 [Verrucomicrobiae bacterium]|nr:hypothetical protein [Verrucomicrobiae bacterium]
MNEGNEMHVGHPLWDELRNGLLWHRTSPEHWRKIQSESFVKPNDGWLNRWGGRYACQQLGGISLFDFTSQSEERALGEAHKWQQFLGDSSPITILLGFERKSLRGKLVPYPDNAEGTAGNVIPWVEVCHCGAISTAAIVAHLLICAVDYRQFRKVKTLNEQALDDAEQAFSKFIEQDRTRQAALNESIRAINESQEFKEAKRKANEMM